MSEESEDKESKTEQPSERKLEESLDKGNIAYSREVTSFMMLLSLTIVTIFILPFTVERVGFSLRLIIEHAGTNELNEFGFGNLIIQSFNRAIFFVLPIFICIISMVILSSFMQQNRFIFAPDRMMPDISRISIMQGIKRMFSLKSLVEFGKGIIKIIITGTIIYYIVMSDIKALSLYPTMPNEVAIKQLFKIINDILISICLFMCAVAVADFFYQKYEHIKGLMMSRHEIKEEYKQTEGSPEIKRKQRQLMQSSAKRRMMTDIPDADVIITNPQHYSIALRYIQGEMIAPIIVAKGLDLIAFKIRKIAEEHDVPIVENPPLARALYVIDLGSPVTVEHYEAVAEIISYVYRLKRKKI